MPSIRTGICSHRGDANYAGNVGDTAPVGRYPANGYDLYDMAGNVWEWCLDVYDSDFYFKFPRVGVARNPLSGVNSVEWLLDNYTGVNGSRVLRGGSWIGTSRVVRVTTRGYDTPSNAYYYLGFRCARTVTPLALYFFTLYTPICLQIGVRPQNGYT